MRRRRVLAPPLPPPSSLSSPLLLPATFFCSLSLSFFLSVGHFPSFATQALFFLLFLSVGHFPSFVTQASASGVDLWLDDGVAPPGPARGYNGTYGDLTYAARAAALIGAHGGGGAGADDAPLFLYCAFQCDHDPLEARGRV